MANEKLFPPFIESKLPAFSNSLTIPFTMNRAVGPNDYKGMKLIIKTAQTGKQLGTLEQLAKEFPYNPKTGKNEVTFNFSSLVDEKGKSLLKQGQYYKVQLAYIRNDDNSSVGYFSSVGIIKKTTNPTLTIPELVNSTASRYSYTGVYSQKKKDDTEKIHMYQFDLLDEDGNIIDSSGECLHDSSTDIESYESRDVWQTKVELENNVMYSLIYSVVTMNGLTMSKSYKIEPSESVDIDLDIAIESKLNYEDGLITVHVLPRDSVKSRITGDFVLVRSSSLNNFSSWDEVHRFKYTNVELSKSAPQLLWEDFSIEQGEEYLYALQGYNSYDLYSNRQPATNGKIKADFEYSFISDGKLQLKLKFNPQMSSFKNIVQEQKVETMGSKYPFVFRNGHVHYKEFPISGLLSLLSDPNEKFFASETWEQQQGRRYSTPGGGLDKKHGTDLTSENIYNERQFKIKVLEWLNNGKPKIFRSPTEGNFLVRIMNVSLSPNDTLGRMLHTLSCTAYEIDEFTFDNLLKYDLVQSVQNKSYTLRFAQIQPGKIFIANDGSFRNQENAKKELAKISSLMTLSWKSGNNKNSGIKLPPAYSLNITEATPGSQFQLHLSDGTTPTIEIGGTGAYYMQLHKSDGIYVNKVVNTLNKDTWGDAKITFEYDDATASDTFSSIKYYTLKTEIRRFVGPGYNNNLVAPKEGKGADNSRILADIRRDLGTFLFIRAEKRYIQEMWYDKENKVYARNRVLTDIIADDEWNPVVIYHDNTNNKFYDGSLDAPMVGEPDFRFSLNSTDYSDFGGRDAENANTVAYSNSFGRIDAIRNLDQVDILRAGNGILLDVAYKVRIKHYVADDEGGVKEEREAWEDAQKELLQMIPTGTFSQIRNKTAEVNRLYNNYISKLTNALNSKERGNS